MRAKATQFQGIVFRSRLEAYSYEYLKLKHNPLCLEYEPKHFSLPYYVPDFIVSHNHYHFAVEVKPSLDKADWPKYKRWRRQFTSIDRFFVMTKESIEEYLSHGVTEVSKLDRLIYFQAINNVKEEIRMNNAKLGSHE